MQCNPCNVESYQHSSIDRTIAIMPYHTYTFNMLVYFFSYNNNSSKRRFNLNLQSFGPCRKSYSTFRTSYSKFIPSNPFA